MAFRYSSGNIRKIVLMILLILLIFGVGILLVDLVGSWFGVYFPIPGLNYIKYMTNIKKLKSSENPYLLEREELTKEKEKLSLLEEQILTKEKEVESMELDVKKKLDTLKNKETLLEDREKMLTDQENRFKNRKENIQEQAVKIINMPPKDAVKLLEQQTESDIVDIIREIDVYFAEIGRNSTSPYLLKLLGDINKEKASNVLRKLKYSAGEKDHAVDILDDEKSETPPSP